MQIYEAVRLGVGQRQNFELEEAGKDQGDEWGTGWLGGTMTGGSLGLRSGSYGSLQQHLPSDARLPIQQTAGNGRKNQRMSLSGSKEKGQARIYRLCCPIRVGMYLAFMASVGALMIVMAGVFLFRRGRAFNRGPQ